MHAHSAGNSSQIAEARISHFLQSGSVLLAMFLASAASIPLTWAPGPVGLHLFVVLAAPFVMRPVSAAFGVVVFMMFAQVLGILGSFALIGYWFGCIAVPWAVHRFPNAPAAGIAAGLILFYALGAGWLKLIGDVHWIKAFEAGVIPRLPFDFLLAVAVYGVARFLSKP